MKLSKFYFSIIAIGICNLPAIAQIEDVVVQSGRLEQKKFDAPASIYTIDAETIRNSGAQVNLSDALAGAPGVVALKIKKTKKISGYKALKKPSLEIMSDGTSSIKQ